MKKGTLFKKNCCVQAQGSLSSEPIPSLVLIYWRSLKAETTSKQPTHMHHHITIHITGAHPSLASFKT